MDAPKTLRPPANWQDFESLCLELFGELWNCPEIQKNGEEGQTQNGVDIYGKPFDVDGYYGIQCKGKADYKNKKFTQQEILEEVEKARGFKPPLKKYYLVTTASNDAKIQEYVRELNLKHIEQGLFEIHVYGWETLVRHIDRNRNTHDWYAKSQNYKTKFSVAVTINNERSQVTCYPKFQRTNFTYSEKNTTVGDSDFYNYPRYPGDFTFDTPFFSRQLNHSYFPIEIVIENDGNEAIEEIKIQLQFDDGLMGFLRDNVIEKYPIVNTKSLLHYTTTFDSDSKIAVIHPADRTLLKGDVLSSEVFFVKPRINNQNSVIKLNWKLFSKHYTTNGMLTINVVPEIKEVYKTIIRKIKIDEDLPREEIVDLLENIDNR